MKYKSERDTSYKWQLYYCNFSHIDLKKKYNGYTTKATGIKKWSTSKQIYMYVMIITMIEKLLPVYSLYETGIDKIPDCLIIIRLKI